LLRIVFSGEKLAVKGPAIFIDRDGVINCRRPGDYVLNWSQFIFMPGIRAALRQLSSLRLPIVVISNQAAVGKGLLQTAGLQEITARMHQSLQADGIFLSAVYYCPHRPDENCDCRKPKTALFRSAADDFNIDVSRSIFIGDSDTDVQAARAAVCKPVLFGSGLCERLDLPGWATSVPIALTAAELFSVASRCLHDRQPSAASIKDG
jgi:histidinol-phosphate phosphatase family protein